jgi:hypothetical protein
MAKGLIGGMTDYNHQSFSDILDDLNDEKKRTNEFKVAITENVDKLKINSYWDKVPYDFKSIVAYSLRHYNTSIEEFDDIAKDIQVEVKEHHVRRLHKIAHVAHEINVDIGKIWHQGYDDKDYDNNDFRVVEQIYCDTRDMAVNLLDVANISDRLKDFNGRQNLKMRKNNPWISGSFYLTVAIIVITGLAVLSNSVHWALLPIIIIGGVLLIVIVGSFQLKNDDKITDKTFGSLITETFKRLPLLRSKD